MDREESEAIERWIDASCKIPVTLDDLSKELAPAMDAKPTGYAFLLSSINPWPMPSIMKKKLETSELDGIQETKITCSISMSFYHSLSKRFYGSTWIGYEHSFSIKSSTKRLPVDNMNELVYFQTRINDPNCFIVIELVLAKLSPLDGSISRRYGCGWTLISLFQQKGTSTGKIALCDGSPRDLLQLKGNGAAILKQLTNDKVKKTASTSYKIWCPRGLGETLASCIRENQIVGAHTTIAGLRRTTINYFDGRESMDETCIGAATRGNVLDWTLSPPEDIASIMASPCILKLGSIRVKLPQRLELERRLETWVTHTLPKGNGRIILNKLFGWSKIKTDGKGECQTTTISRRRLKVGLHNLHTILHNQWHTVDLQIEDNEDNLRAIGDVQITSYADHPSCALLFLVEYEMKTVQSARSLQSPNKMVTNTTNVALGLAVFCSMDKRNLKGEITLALTNDARCQALSTEPLFSQAPDESAEPQSLSFELCASDKNSPNEGPKKRVTPKNRNAKPETKSDESISLDGSVKSRFLRINCEDGMCSLSLPIHHDSTSSTESLCNSRVDEESSFPDTSTITLGGDTTANQDTAREERNQVTMPAKASYSTSIELGDVNAVTSVTISLHSFNVPTSKYRAPTSRRPKALSFQLKLFSYDEIRTDSFQMRCIEHGIFKFTSCPSSISFAYDYSTAESAEELARYLMDRDLFVEVFDEYHLHVGTIVLPMHLFLRQGKERLLENLSVDIVTPQYHDDASDPFSVAIGKPFASPSVTREHLVAGSIILSIHCVGSKSDEPGDPGTPTVDSKQVAAQNLAKTRQEVQSLSLDLYDVNGVDGRISGQSNAGCEKSVRQQQLRAVEDFRLQRQRDGLHKDNAEQIDSFFRKITPAEEYGAECQALNAIQWAREGKKKHLLARHMKKSEAASFTIRPWVGERAQIGPYKFTNPLGTSVQLKTEANHSGVVLISEAEWSNGIGGDHECNQITVQPHETLLVPLAFDCTEITERATINVSLISVHTGDILTSIIVQVHPQLRVDRRFILACSKNEYLRRTFSLSDTNEEDVSNNGRRMMKCVDNTSTKGVHCTWRISDEEFHNELQVDFRCPGKSLCTERFYVVFSNDRFNTLLECWEFIINTKTPIYDTVQINYEGQKEIQINQRISANCLVQAIVLPSHGDIIGSKMMCTCEPESFYLTKGIPHKFHVRFRFFDEGRRKILIHIVDQETGALVGAFNMSLQVHLPRITKAYDVNVIQGQKKHIKLPFTNCANEKAFVDVTSNNEEILAPLTECNDMELDGGDTLYLRFQILVDEAKMNGRDDATIDAFLFALDKSTNIEDCFRIRIHVQEQQL